MSKNIGTVIGISVRREKDATVCTRIDADGKELEFSPAEAKDYFDNHPTYAGIQSVEIDGQHMVCIPAFYAATASNEDGAAMYWISPEAREGFHMHPAFMVRTYAAPRFLISAYEGSLTDENVVCSLPDMDTAGNRDFHDMRVACLARNTRPDDGWDMMNIYQLAAIQRLAMIEAGSTDSQAVYGSGNVGMNGRLPTGKSGLAWRGIHDLWGNSWCMVYGLETDESHQVFLLDNCGHGNLLPTGIHASCDDNGYITAMHDESGPFFDLGDIFLPKAVSDDQDEATFPDYFWRSWPGERNVAYHGGDWGDGSSAGLFTLGLSYTASSGNANIGCRLAKAGL